MALEFKILLSKNSCLGFGIQVIKSIAVFDTQGIACSFRVNVLFNLVTHAPSPCSFLEFFFVLWKHRHFRGASSAGPELVVYVYWMFAKRKLPVHLSNQPSSADMLHRWKI